MEYQSQAVGEEKRKWIKDFKKQMILKPSATVGGLTVGTLTRGRYACKCGEIHQGGFDPDFAMRFLQLSMPLNTKISFIITSGLAIADARNAMVSQALGHGSQYLFTTDDDMLIEPFTVIHMYQQIKMQPDAGIIAGWSVSKSGAFREPFVYIDDDLTSGVWFGIVDEFYRLQAKAAESFRKSRSGEEMTPDDHWIPERDIPLIEVAAVGTGVQMISLEWAKKICNPPAEPCQKHRRAYCGVCTGHPWFQEGEELENTHDDKGTGDKGFVRTWGQDIWFSKEMRRVGAKILIDPMMFVPHKDVSSGIVYGPPLKRKVVTPRGKEIGDGQNPVRTAGGVQN